MLAIVSPAKKLDMTSPAMVAQYTMPRFLDRSEQLIDIMKGKSRQEIQTMMKLSEKLAELNYQRYHAYCTPFTLDNAKQAAYMFRGDTYVGLDADSLDEADMLYAQDHLAILSGLYGLARPLDLLQPYRLEMGTKLSNQNGEDLYDFWADEIAQAIDGYGHEAVINLASNEYMRAVPRKSLKTPMITCHFKELKNGQAKIVGLFAKRARGMMARYMIQNRIENPADLKDFAEDGYVFQPDMSDQSDYVFLRG